MKRLFNKKGDTTVQLFIFFILAFVLLLGFSIKTEIDYNKFIKYVKNESIEVLEENQENGYVTKKSIKELNETLNDKKTMALDIIIDSDKEPIEYSKDMFISIKINRTNSKGGIVNSDLIYETIESKYSSTKE